MHIQEVNGVLLYYAWAVDATLLVALNTLATQQVHSSNHDCAHPTLNYCATHPNATICYHASNMVLWTHSNESYLTTSKG